MGPDDHDLIVYVGFDEGKKKEKWRRKIDLRAPHLDYCVGRLASQTAG